MIKKIIPGLNLLIAIAGVCMLAFLISKSISAMGKFSDFPEYYVPAKMVVEGHGSDSYLLSKLGQAQHELFSGMGNRVVVLFVPPQGLSLIAAIGFPKASVAWVLWKAIMIACLIASIVFLTLTFSLNYKQVCYLIATLSISYPCYEALRIDQLAPILLLSLCGAIYCLRKNRDITAGLLLSLMILKPQQILPFLAFLAGMRRWRPLAIMSGMLVLLTAISYWQIGNAGFSNYYHLVRQPGNIVYMQPELNPTIRGQLLRLIPGHVDTVLAIAMVIYALLLGLSYYYGQQVKNKPDSLLKGVLGIIPIALVTSLHCHDYDLLLLVPPLIIIFTDYVIPFGSATKLFLTLASIPFLLPLAINIHYDYLLKGGPINILFWELLALTLVITYHLCYFNRKTDT